MQRTRWSGFRDVWRLIKPYWVSRDKWKGWLLLATIVGMALGQVYISVLHRGQRAMLLNMSDLKHGIIPAKHRQYRLGYLDTARASLDVTASALTSTLFDWRAADWDEVMRGELGVDRLADAWQKITASAGPLQTIGHSSVVP